MDESTLPVKRERGSQDAGEAGGARGDGGEILDVPIPVTVMVEQSIEDTYGSEYVENSEDEGCSRFLGAGRKRKSEVRFMEKDAVISLLLDSESQMKVVPNGPKVNHYFLLDDDKNFIHGRRRMGRNSFFMVDNIINWESTSWKKHHYLYTDGEYKYVDCIGGKYLLTVTTTAGIHEASQLDTKADEILVIKKHYSSIAGEIKRRISYIDKLPEGVESRQATLLLVEYIADHSGAIPMKQRYLGMQESTHDEENVSDAMREVIDNAVEIIVGGEQQTDGGEFSRNLNETESLTHPGDLDNSGSDVLDVSHLRDRKECIEDVRDKMGVDNKGRFFDKNDAIEILLKAETSMAEIPQGFKENEYFIIDNEENYQRNRAGKRRIYVDDCGVWKSVSMKKHYYTCVNGNYLYVDLVGGKFKVAKSMTRGQEHTPPDRSEILVMRKVYGSLKRDEDYKRRISWIDEFPAGIVPKQKNIALVEYIGKYPKEVLPHGNQKGPGAAPYVRTPAKLMKEMKEKVASKTAKEAMADLAGIALSPRDLKQLQNLRYRSTLKIGPGAAKDELHNDDLRRILSMVHAHPYVQQAVCTKYKPPMVITYTAQQMNSWRYHCHEKSGLNRIIGIDRTINIGPTCLTMLMYCHPNLLCRVSLAPAIMLGPILFHVDKSWQTYSSFFSHLKGCLSNTENTDIEGVSIACSSDEEKPIIQALHFCFPDTAVVLCCDHLKNDLKKFLSTEVGLVDHSVETVAEEIFSELLGCTEEYDFDMKVLNFQSEYDASIPQFSHYFRKLTENIRDSIWRPAIEQRPLLKWDTISCEALNNTMKMLPSWDKLRLPELLLRLNNIVRLQEQDEVRALYDEGNYVLAPHAKRYQVEKADWLAKTNKQRARLAESLRKFKTGPGRNAPRGKQDAEEWTDAGLHMIESDKDVTYI